MAGRSFRSEIERQLLEIHHAFSGFVDGVERERRDALTRLSAAEGRLREMERQQSDAQERLRAMERENRDLEGQLRKLQKSFPVRFLRFVKRSNPLRSARKDIR